MEDNNLGITGADRLDRIERLLEKVLEKMDQKAELAAVVDLQARVRDLELHGSSQAQDAQQRLREVHNNVDRLSGRVTYGAGAISTVIIGVNVILFLITHH